MRITFFKTPRPKEFNYIPRYYDERKEEMEERKKRIEQELGLNKGKDYKHGITRGAMTRRMTERRKSNRSSVIRLLVIIAILLILTYYLLSGTFSFNFLGN
jgi:hypothetical protein